MLQSASFAGRRHVGFAMSVWRLTLSGDSQVAPFGNSPHISNSYRGAGDLCCVLGRDRPNVLHRWDYAVLADKNGAGVQRTIRLPFGRHEYTGAGDNVRLVPFDNLNNRHISGYVDFLLTAL